MDAKFLRIAVLVVFLAGVCQLVSAAGSYVVVDTNQAGCYDTSTAVSCPAIGEAFYGQDSQYAGSQMNYQDNGDGTVSDLNTGLMWQQSPDFSGDGFIDVSDKYTFDEAVASASTFNLAGYTDWRLPTIKELYSLIDFSGSTGASAASSVPYIDTNYFGFGYGDEVIGERYIDAQYCSSTQYVSTTMNGSATVFGVNHADGRIKGYGIARPNGGTEKLFYVRYVRGNESYGVNCFVDNGDGTVTDMATGLMWQQGDSGAGMNWQGALAYAEGISVGGYDDWRLPNAKELQSIVDYSRSPDTTGSAAIDPVFGVTSIIDEGGSTNYPFYWTSTTHSDGPNDSYAVYVTFGEALGWMEQPPGSGNYNLLDVHGAGAQRSDPKSGDPADYPYGHGPQGDVIRINNYVRAVRGMSTTFCQSLVNGGDKDGDCDVDFNDLLLFSDDWLGESCGLCGGSDYTDDEKVDNEDFAVVSENWGRQEFAEPEEFTNLVLIVADDMGFNDVGYNGSIIETPSIDSIASDGVVLNNYYAYPICGPSRVALMTGRSPVRLGRTGNIQAGDGLDLDEHLMPETFKAAGFQTWCLGKWHLGGNPDTVYLPQNRGFDHFYGFIGGSINPYTHMSGNNLDWQRNGVDVVEEGYSADLLAAEAVSLLENRDTSGPVLLYLPFHLVHTPLRAPQELIDKYVALGVTDPNRCTYAAMADALDTAIGRVLQKIDDEGMRDNTLVVFVSDNGGNETEGGASNYPLRGQKGQTWDGGIRVPAAMRWPGVLTPSTVSSQVVSIMDLFPTLTAALGVEPQNVRAFDGKNLWSNIRDGQVVDPEAIVIQKRDAIILDGQWKLVQLKATGEELLYDIRNDESETMDLSATYPAVVTDLSAKLQAMLDTAP